MFKRLPHSAVSRRAFIGTAGSLAVGAVTFGPVAQCLSAESGVSTTKKALVGSNIYGWGQYAQRENRKLDVGEVISALRDCGYDYLENFMDLEHPEESARFAEMLKAKGLRPVSLYSGARLHEAGKTADSIAKILAAARVASQAGFVVLSCNPDPIGREKTDEELKTQAAALTELGKGLNALGMRLGVHHHMPEMANGAREFHYNFKHTQPAEVGFCYDVHWVWKGGVSPADALKAYGERVVTWHLRQSRDGIWIEDLDAGDVDYGFVAEQAKQRSLPGRFTVELAIENGTKITRSVVDNHRRSRDYVRKIFGA
jgi:inosose dehydratase